MISKVKFSFIIPVFNRAEELKELLDSFVKQKDNEGIAYEIIVVDDGSTDDIKAVTDAFASRLPVRYIRKENTGPGDSRNRAMQMAAGTYFIILDSDIVLPEHYLKRLSGLEKEGKLSGMGGGPDTSHAGFSPFQKAVDLVMTSYSTTGGIRGKKKNTGRYVPRSFNMIVHRKVYEQTGGFSAMHPGEDPEWVYKAWQKGFSSAFYPELYVYHKRRIDLKSFYRQMRKFGIARVILNRNFPKYAGIVYYFPLAYTIGLMIGSVLAISGYPQFILLYVLYWIPVFVEFVIRSKNPIISLTGLFLLQVQMFAYASGFIEAMIKLGLLSETPQKAFPQLFFKLEKEKNTE
jgi:glycosyltransferase involved in cell wall biosynthesis